MTTSIIDRDIDEARWQAVLSRERAAGFIYAVRSTGVYCRPACPSRRPSRSRVVFFDEAVHAAAAGFRPCLRCQPDDAPAGDRFTARVLSLIDAAEEAPRLDDLAREAGVSPSHLLRVFKAQTGLTPRQYAAARRVGRLKAELRGGSSVTSAAYEAGFGSSRALYELAPRGLGMTPRAYKSRGQGEQISYAVVESALGPMIVAATGKGLCFAGWGDPPGLVADLRAEFPAAGLIENAEAAEPYAEAIRAYLRGEPPSSVKLDVRGTPFQLAVWAALTAIPPGETRTYAQLALAVGKPTSAARAVGRACALNLVAPVVPCHRAVGASGSLTGYRWGIERKRALLEIEQGA